MNSSNGSVIARPAGFCSFPPSALTLPGPAVASARLASGNVDTIDGAPIPRAPRRSWGTQRAAARRWAIARNSTIRRPMKLLLLLTVLALCGGAQIIGHIVPHSHDDG